MAIERAPDEPVEEPVASSAASITFDVSGLPERPAVGDVVRWKVAEIDEDGMATAKYYTEAAPEKVGIESLTADYD